VQQKLIRKSEEEGIGYFARKHSPPRNELFIGLKAPFLGTEQRFSGTIETYTRKTENSRGGRFT